MDRPDYLLNPQLWWEQMDWNVPLHLLDPANLIPAQPIAIWMNIAGDDVTQVFMYSIGSHRNDPGALRVPLVLPFVFHNREVELNINVTEGLIGANAVQKITAFFGENVNFVQLNVHNAALTASLLSIAESFVVQKVHVLLQRNSLQGLENLGEITALSVDGRNDSENFRCIENSPNILHLNIWFNPDERGMEILSNVVRQWKNGLRDIHRWVLRYDGRRFLRNRDFERQFQRQDGFTLNIKVLEDHRRDVTQAVFFTYPPTDYCCTKAAADSTTPGE